MNHLRNGYVAKFFKNFYFIPVLFITSILSTLFIGCERFGVFANLMTGKFAKYNIYACSYFSLIYITYAFAECKNQKLTVVDPTNIAIMLTSLIYAFYVLFISKTFTLIKLLVSGAFFIVILFVTVMRTVYFNPYEKKGKVYYTKNSINAYYRTLTKNHTFFAIFLFSIALTCLSYLVISSNFIVNFKSSKVILPIIVAGVFLSLLTFNSISKKISVLDAALLGVTLSLLPILTQILFVAVGTLKRVYLSYWTILLGTTIILTILRFIFFDISKIGKDTSESFSNVRIINYIKKISHKYGWGIIITVSIFTVIFFLFTITFADVTNFFKMESGQLSIRYGLIPSCIINLLFIGTLILGAILSASGLKATKITFADFLMLTNLIFSVVASSIFALQKTLDWRIYSLSILFAYSLIMALLRIIKVCPKNID